MVMAAAGAGVVVALAPVLPGAIRDPLVVASLAVWVALACAGCAALLREAWLAARRRESDWMLGAIAVAGTLVAVVMAAQVELIRVLEARPAFSWMLDWRWSLNHAQAIARSGNIFHALDYSGVGLDYHVGPAWFAASVARLFGGGMADVLFGIIPPLCVVTMVVAAALILRSTGLRGRLAAVAVVAAITWPASQLTPTWVVHGPLTVLLGPYNWQFLATDMMLNSFLGYAVGLAGVALLLDREAGTSQLALGALALAACEQIKPQYFVGLGIVAGVVMCWRLVAEPGNRRRTLGLAAAVLASLLLAVVARTSLPGDVALFEAPRLGAPNFRELAVDLRRTHTLVALAALAIWLFLRRGRRAGSETPKRWAGDSAPRIDLLAAAAVASIGLAFALRTIIMPVRSAYVENGQALRLHDIYPTYLTADLLQGADPGRFLLLAAGIGVIGAALLANRRRFGAPLAAACALLVCAPIPLLAAGFRSSPPSEYAAAEDAGLYSVLHRLPVEGAVLISSDLADPANDYQRPLRAPLLTAYGGHQFYVSDLRYVHYVRPDAVERSTELRQFFGARWSPWHDAWLARHHITQVLVDSRCTPVWLGEAGVPLTPRLHSGNWTVWQVPVGIGGLAQGASQPPQPPSEWRDITPATGHADCLLGGQNN
jgi:hypothetical protein